MTKDDDLMTAGREFCRMHRRVIGFSTTVGKERLLQTAGRNLGKLLRQIGLRFVAVKRGSMRNRFDLIDDRFVDLWIRMPDADCQNAAETIEILVALVIPDVKAFAFYEGERFLVIDPTVTYLLHLAGKTKARVAE